MTTFLLKEPTKLEVMPASIDDPNLEDTDALTKLIIEFYEDIETFAQMLEFSKDKIENMDKTTAVKLISKYID